MSNLNAFHVAPVGYARSYITVSSHGCPVHPTYYPLCPHCGWAEQTVTVRLADDVIALILDSEDGSVIEFLTADSGIEFATSVAHQGEVVIREDALDSPCPVVVALASESRLYADCFNVLLSRIWPSVA